METVATTRKRKRSMATPTSDLPIMVSFDHLPQEAQLGICRRLCGKDLSRTMCISKQWREAVIHNCLTMVAPSGLSCFRFLLRLETKAYNHKSSGLSIVYKEPDEEQPSFRSYPLLRRCSRIMECKISCEMLIEGCNGLLLFCHREGKAENTSDEFYYYYVMNPITKQCTAVLKPGPKTARFMYAALAYDPSESSFFRIAQFQGSQIVNVFSSETGEWVTLKSHLPKDVRRGTWDKKSVYYEGALYRLSDSGHLVKFLLHPQANMVDQAIAIKLPGAFLKTNKSTIGLRNKQFTYATISETSLFIYELKVLSNGKENTYEWTLLHSVYYKNLRTVNFAGQVLAIHPHLEMVLLKLKPYIFFFHYSANQVTVERYPSAVYGEVAAFPIIECSIPFTCCFDRNRMNNGIFHRLSMPNNNRRNEE